MIRSLSLITLFVLLPGAVNAMPITFDLRASVIESIDESASFSLTADGITATLSTTAGVLNRTSSGFGVNASGGGDDTDALDDGTGIVEAIAIGFDQAIQLAEITVSGFGSGDAGGLIVGTSDISITNSGSHAVNTPVLATNETAQLRFLQGNGFSFDAFSILPATTESVAVTGPVSLGLLLLGGLGILGCRRKNC